MNPALSDDEGMISLQDFFGDSANHAPRAEPGQDSTAGTAETAPSVFDPTTGRVRIMDSKCSTCIGRAGNAIGLSPQRRRELIGLRPDGTYDEGWTVCHSTLPGNSDDLPPAVCAWNAQHPQASARSLAVRLAAVSGTDHITPTTH